jgi:TRAP-type transport system small permease protein
MRAAYEAALEWLLIVLMAVLFFEVTLGVVYRTIGVSLVWYDEVASILLAWITFYGSALASVKRAHIGCPEVVDQFSPAAKRVLGIVAQVLVIAFFALFGWVGLSIMPVLVGDSLVSLPWVSMNFVQSVVPISAALILVGEVMHLVDLVTMRAPAQGPSNLADGLH